MDKDVHASDSATNPLPRRTFLRRTLTAGLLAGFDGFAEAALPATPIPRLDKGVPFHWDQLISRARTLASAPFQAESNATVINRWIDSLHAVHPKGIHMIPQAFLGTRNSAPFLIEGLYPDNQQRKAVSVFLVENGEARQWIFRGNQFDYGDAAVAANAPQNLFYGGIAIWLPGAKAPFLRFDGIGQYAAAVIPGQFDTEAAFVDINPAVRPTRGENKQTLRTRAIYLHVPSDRWSPLEMSLLIDSVQLSGAIHLRWVRLPDGSLRSDHHHIWFIRDRLAQLGLAPQHTPIPREEGLLRCNRLYMPTTKRAAARAVCMLDERRQQIWRPLANQGRTTLTVFDTRMPVGYGLLHRFNPAATDSRPLSPENMQTQCWTVPGPGWPRGNLELIEADTTPTHNSGTATARRATLAWVPERARASLAQQQRPLAISFRQIWSLEPDRFLTTMLQVTDSRMRCDGNQRDYQLLVEIDFMGGLFSRDPDAIKIQPQVHSTRGTLDGTQLDLGRADNGEAITTLRFTLTANGPEPIGLRAGLRHDKHNISEIWLFTYLPGL